MGRSDDYPSLSATLRRPSNGDGSRRRLIAFIGSDGGAFRCRFTAVPLHRRDVAVRNFCRSIPLLLLVHVLEERFTTLFSRSVCLIRHSSLLVWSACCNQRAIELSNYESLSDPKHQPCKEWT